LNDWALSKDLKAKFQKDALSTEKFYNTLLSFKKKEISHE